MAQEQVGGLTGGGETGSCLQGFAWGCRHSAGSGCPGWICACFSEASGTGKKVAAFSPGVLSWRRACPILGRECRPPANQRRERTSRKPWRGVKPQARHQDGARTPRTRGGAGVQCAGAQVSWGRPVEGASR